MIASSLQIYGDISILSAEIIEYGVRTGRIPADKAPKPKSKVEKATTGPKPLATTFEIKPPELNDDLGLLFEIG